MGFINRLEKKFGRFAINNLIFYVLGAYAVGYILLAMAPQIYVNLLMDPRLICKGQVWRLFTWIFTIPQELDIFVIFMFMFYFWIGSSLERYWGTFKYNLYIFSGWFFMTIGAMAIYLISLLATENGIVLNVSTYYINLTSFLACAIVFPDAQLLLFMIIPVKMKWLAIVDLIVLGYEFITHLSLVLQYTNIELFILTNGSYSREKGIAVCASIVISLLNFALFYFGSKNGKRFAPKEIKRKREFRKQVNINRGITKHKCAICGRSENDGQGLVFRFCSRCDGNYEYCQDHLFTHEHVKNED